MSDNRISVIIPTYYRNERLRRTIDSVLDQTHDPVELVVVDDSGDAHARSVVTDYEDITYIANERNEGAHTSRNHGVERATGAYVNFLDDDDRIHPEKLSKQVALLERGDADVVYCGFQGEHGATVLPDPAVRGTVLERALRFDMEPCRTSTMVIDSDVLHDIMPLYTESEGAGDFSMMIDLARRTTFDFVDEPLVFTGRPAYSLGTGWSAVEGRKKLLDEYRELYDRFEPDIYRAALAETSLQEGRRHLNESQWSLAAIAAFARAVYYDPDGQLVYRGELAASLFGSRGRRLIGRLATATGEYVERWRSSS